MMMPEVGSKWRSLTTRRDAVWTVRDVTSSSVELTDGTGATRICPHHLFASHYEASTEGEKE